MLVPSHPIQTSQQHPKPCLWCGVVSALCLHVLIAAFALSLWMEQGPYHWAAAVQYQLMETYSQKITMIVTACFFSIFIIALIKPVMRSGCKTQLLAFGLPVLIGLIHFLISLYVVTTGGKPSMELSLDDAVRRATFFPQAVLMAKGELDGMDYTTATRIAHESKRMSQSSPKYNGFHYILIDGNESREWSMPVVMKSSGIMLERMSEETYVEGLIYRAPLPFQIREAWGDRAANQGVIFSNGESPREYWSSTLLLYGVLLIGCLLAYISRRKKQA